MKPDLEGRVFGRWTVTGPHVKRTPDQKAHWPTRCVCGSIGHVQTYELLGSHSTSCGCSRRLHWSERRSASPKPPRLPTVQVEFRLWDAQRHRYMGWMPFKRQPRVDAEAFIQRYTTRLTEYRIKTPCPSTPPPASPQ